MEIFILILAVFLLTLTVFNFFTIRKPTALTGISRGISVLIPVRNESENIPGLVETLKAQTHVDEIEFIFINDSSTDDTKAQIQEKTLGDPRFILVDAPVLKEGWLGKPWALQQGFLVSRRNIVICLDADVRLSTTALAQGVQLLEKSQLEFISPYPRQIATTFTERLIQPLLQWSWLSTVPLRLAERISIPSMAVANGQFFIIARSALEKINGFTSIATQVIDDVELARSLIRSGSHGSVVDGSGLAVTRMYSSFSELRQGYGKSLWKGFGGKLGTIFVILFLALTGLAPLILALTSHPSGWIAFFMVALSRILSAIRAGGRVADSLLHPFSISLLIYLIAYSWKSRGLVQWKGRTLSWLM
jgi:cellulose synthase/poly-beta-1,6-N-acetylglucosamine synthase-like glycosyltransferase